VLKYNPAENEKVTNATFISKSDLSNSLMSKLRNERNKLHTLTASRHSQFGGMLEVKKSLGDKKLLSMSGPHSKGLCSTSLVEMKRKTKKHQYFVASGRTVAAHTRPSAAYSSATHEAGPASIKAQKTLHRFCHRFVTQCYGSVMKSLKNEFRLDSKRLEDGDKVIFFRIVWFFCQWWRVSVSEGNMTSLSSKDESNNTHHGVDPCKSAVGNLIFNMDVFTFNLVLTASDFFYDHKKFKDLAQTVSLYTEMMHLLHLMYTSSDNTEQIMAMGLMDRLFYQSEPIDRLPRLIQRWAPGTFTREYVCELIELTHVTLKLLDAHSVLCEDVKPKEEKKRKRGKKKNLEEEPIDTISRMKAIAAEFDVTSYMARKLISNQTVLMFTQVLSQHHLNASHINQDIISFFVRLCRFTVASDDNDDFDGLAPNADGKNTTITLEAMLFNLPLFQVLQEILQDKNLHNLKEYEHILTFATTIVRHFSEACEKNPLLYVECLFKHNFPHRFCESIANFYVSDELRMIIERDMLLEEHKKLEQHYDEADESDDDEELEFTDDIDRGIQKKQTNISDQTDKSSTDEGVDAVLNDDPSETESNPDDHADDGTSNIITKHDKELALSKDNDNYSTQYDENEMEDENSLNDISISEKEKNDERWNDRRQFIPKRKVNEVTENENTSEDGSPLTKKRHFSNRIRKTVIDESDEDEEEQEQFNSPQELSKHRPTGRILLDDDDDDE
jgi:timeless